MKKSAYLAVIALALAIAMTSAEKASQKAQSADVLLGAALHQEEVEGNLEAAIQTYKKLLAEYPGNRPLAARALLQMGRCYEKLGKEGARNAYERLVRDYADQSEAAAQARARLAALHKPPVASKEPALATRKVWALPDIGNIEGAPSPDGKYLSFTDWETGDLAIRDLEAGTNRRLTDKGPWEKSDEFAMFSRWSPDGKQIAYDWYDGTCMDLRVIALEGGNPRTLFDNKNGEWMQTFDWSPDGEQILIFLEKKDATRQIVLVSATDGAARIVKTFKGRGRFPNIMRFSGDGRCIAYDQPQKENAAERDIFLIPVAGGQEVALVEHPAQDLLLGWPTNGEGILFASDRTGSLDIWFLPVSGGKVHGSPDLVRTGIEQIVPLGFTQNGSFYYAQGGSMLDAYVAKMDRQSGKILAPPEKAIQRFEGANSWPEYSPDGKFLAYVSTRSRTFQAAMKPNVVCICSLETGQEQEFTTKFNRLAGTRWSPDGQFLYLAAWDDQGMGIYRADTHTGAMTPIVRDEGSQRIRSHDVSPDGKTLIYVRRIGEAPPEGLFRIVSRNVATGEEKDLYAGKPGQRRFIIALSPDGEQLAFINLDEKRTLRVMPAKGGPARDVLTYAENGIRYTPLEWTADGKSILFTRAPSSTQLSLWRVPADGGQPQDLGLVMANFENLSVHPDGVRLAFTSVGPKITSPSVWVMENYLPPSAVRLANRDSNLVIRRVPNLDMYAKPSPDGKHISYTDWETGNLGILETATGAKRLLTKDGSMKDESTSYAGFCEWSPDSQRIAYIWEIFEPKQGRTELRLISLAGDSPPSTIPVPESTPANWIWGWMPDGYRILCSLTKDRGMTSELVLIDLRSHQIEKVNPGFDNLEWIIQNTGEEDTVLYSRPAHGAGTPFDIYLGNLKTGKSSAIVEHPAEDLLVGVLPGTNWLLFASDRRGRLDLWGVPFREGKVGGPPVLVKQGIGRFYPLGFTNDGRLYYETLSATDDIFFADFDPETHRIVGEPRKLISPWEGTNMGPDFSPDGKSIAYVTKRNPMPVPVHSADSLVVQSLDTPESEPIVFGFAELHLRRVAGPRWVGERSIVLTGNPGDSAGLFRVDLAGSRKEKIHARPTGHGLIGHECAAKNGLVYFIDLDPEKIFSVLRIDSAGGNEQPLFRAPEGQRITSIALSPDEKTLAIITSSDALGRALMVMPAEGGTPRRVHEFKQQSRGSVPLAWAPDGESIFFIIREEEEWTWGIHRVPAEGGETSETVTKLKGPIYGLKFHPNGHLLTYVGRSGASSDAEAWVMENLKEELKKLALEAGRR